MAVKGSAMDARVQQALELQQRGDLALAEVMYRGIIATDPGHVQVLGLLAMLHRAQGRHAESLAGFSRIAELNPAIAPAHNGRGLASILVDMKKRSPHFRPPAAQIPSGLSPA